jgi:hypothetical protein
MTWGFHSSCGIESSSLIEPVGTRESAGIWVPGSERPSSVGCWNWDHWRLGLRSSVAILTSRTTCCLT